MRVYGTRKWPIPCVTTVYRNGWSGSTILINRGIFLKWPYHGWMIYFVYNDASLFTMTFEKFLVKDKTTALCETKKTTKVNFEKLLGQQVLKNHYRAYSLTWPASMQIYGNKRKFLHKKRVQLPQDLFGAPIWPPWRHVKTPHCNPFQSSSSLCILASFSISCVIYNFF